MSSWVFRGSKGGGGWRYGRVPIGPEYMILVISSTICYWDIAKVVFYCPPKEVLIRRLICQILSWKLIGHMMNENLRRRRLVRMFYLLRTCFVLGVVFVLLSASVFLKPSKTNFFKGLWELISFFYWRLILEWDEGNDICFTCTAISNLYVVPFQLSPFLTLNWSHFMAC